MAAANRDRMLGTAFLVGAALAAVANGLHPIFAASATELEILAKVADTGYWEVLHIITGVAGLVLASSLMVVLMQARGTAGEAAARVATALGIIGVTIFTIQIFGIDGAVYSALADALAAGGDPAVIGPAAAGFVAFDVALLSLVVAVFFGATFVAAASALAATGRYAGWLITVARASGWAGVVIGLLMLLHVGDEVTFYAFRVVALGVTVVAVGLGVTLRRAAG